MIPIAVVIVVLTLTHRYNTVRGHRTGFTGQAAITLERKITSGGKQTKQKTITQ